MGVDKTELIDKVKLLNCIYSDNPKDIMVYIADFPSIEIVRCKECKHFMPYSDIERAVTPYKDTDGICHGGYPRANDFFCAYGERRSE